MRRERLIGRARWRLFVAILAFALTLAAGYSVQATARPVASPGDAKANGTPVVLVVFDELPTATLINAQGRIDAHRFPGFAALARGSTWYRENTTVADFTGRAVPAIFTGNSPDKETLPVASAQPNSLFSLLGGQYRFHVQEAITQLCPPRFCAGKGARASSAVAEFIEERFRHPDPVGLERFIDRIPASRSTLTVLHAALPHEPFQFLPSGQRYARIVLTWPNIRKDPGWVIGKGGIASVLQRHMLQTGLTDRLLRRLLKRLKRTGLWNRAIVVVTADHGMSFKPKAMRRIADRGNLGEVANPPLFIRYPGGEGAGTVSKVHSRTIDILPTLAQQLELPVPFETLGQPISQRRPGGSLTVQAGNRKVVRAPLSRMIAQRRAAVKRRDRWLGRAGLGRLGPRSDLIGTRPSRTLRADRASFELEVPRRYSDYRPGRDTLPAFITGSVHGLRPGSPVAVAVNGRIVGVTYTFRFKGEIRFGLAAVHHRLRCGPNSVALYEIRPNRMRVRIHRL